MTAYIVWFILFEIPLVLLVHEIGHLIAARWYGVRVLCLSVGLGPEVLGLTDRHGTRWTLAVLPLGGCLKMSEDGLSNKALHRRAAVVAAGPLASLLLAGAVYGSSFAIFGEGTLRGIESENSTIVVASLLTEFSFFVALFSLIPIPPLDGGWLAFFGIEALTGKPIPERIQKKLCTLGMAMLVFVTIISAFAVAT